MNKKFFWFLGFLVVGAISCWATASSFHLMLPGMPLLAVWGMTIVFFVLASYAVKLMIDAINNDGSLNHPKAQLWGGLLLLIFTWIIISLPTNAHTFFYRLKIGDVVTDDLKTTKVYSQQLADRVVVDSAFYDIEQYINKEWSLFTNEVQNGAANGKRGIGPIALAHFNNINNKLGSSHSIPQPVMSVGQKYDNASITETINYWKLTLIDPALLSIKSDQYMVNMQSSRAAKVDVSNIIAMEDSIHQLIMTGEISSSDAEPVIKQAEGVLIVAYTNIKNNKQFVIFNDEDDEQLYTAANLETKTTRFLNPYSVAYDFFSGKIPASFTFWLLLSILIDVAGFFFFDKAAEKEYSF